MSLSVYKEKLQYLLTTQVSNRLSRQLINLWGRVSPTINNVYLNKWVEIFAINLISPNYSYSILDNLINYSINYDVYSFLSINAFVKYACDNNSIDQCLIEISSLPNIDSHKITNVNSLYNYIVSLDEIDRKLILFLSRKYNYVYIPPLEPYYFGYIYNTLNFPSLSKLNSSFFDLFLPECYQLIDTLFTNEDTNITNIDQPPLSNSIFNSIVDVYSAIQTNITNALNTDNFYSFKNYLYQIDVKLNTLLNIADSSELILSIKNEATNLKAYISGLPLINPSNFDTTYKTAVLSKITEFSSFIYNSLNTYKDNIDKQTQIDRINLLSPTIIVTRRTTISISSSETDSTSQYNIVRQQEQENNINFTQQNEMLSESEINQQNEDENDDLIRYIIRKNITTPDGPKWVNGVVFNEGDSIALALDYIFTQKINTQNTINDDTRITAISPQLSPPTYIYGSELEIIYPRNYIGRVNIDINTNNYRLENIYIDGNSVLDSSEASINTLDRDNASPLNITFWTKKYEGLPLIIQDNNVYYTNFKQGYTIYDPSYRDIYKGILSEDKNNVNLADTLTLSYDSSYNTQVIASTIKDSKLYMWLGSPYGAVMCSLIVIDLNTFTILNYQEYSLNITYASYGGYLVQSYYPKPSIYIDDNYIYIVFSIYKATGGLLILDKLSLNVISYSEYLYNVSYKVIHNSGVINNNGEFCFINEYGYGDYAWSENYNYINAQITLGTLNGQNPLVDITLITNFSLSDDNSFILHKEGMLRVVDVRKIDTLTYRVILMVDSGTVFVSTDTYSKVLIEGAKLPRLYVMEVTPTDAYIVGSIVCDISSFPYTYTPSIYKPYIDYDKGLLLFAFGQRNSYSDTMIEGSLYIFDLNKLYNIESYTHDELLTVLPIDVHSVYSGNSPILTWVAGMDSDGNFLVGSIPLTDISLSLIVPENSSTIPGGSTEGEVEGG